MTKTLSDAEPPCGDPSCNQDRERRMVRTGHTTASGKPVFCDPCIAPVVQALNDAGIHTVASCCGHGYRPGSIALADGRWLIIARDDTERQRIDAMFPVDINGDSVPTPPPAPVSAPVSDVEGAPAFCEKYCHEDDHWCMRKAGRQCRTALRTPHELPGEVLKFHKEHYGATVATLIDTEDTIVEISARSDGDYKLIVHNREGERDTFRDCSALLKPKHFAALGTLANRPSPAGREDV